MPEREWTAGYWRRSVQGVACPRPRPVVGFREIGAASWRRNQNVKGKEGEGGGGFMFGEKRKRLIRVSSRFSRQPMQ